MILEEQTEKIIIENDRLKIDLTKYHNRNYVLVFSLTILKIIDVLTTIFIINYAGIEQEANLLVKLVFTIHPILFYFFSFIFLGLLFFLNYLSFQTKDFESLKILFKGLIFVILFYCFVALNNILGVIIILSTF